MPRRAPEMRGAQDPQLMAELKAAAAAQRETERFEKMTPEELMAAQRAVERSNAGIVELGQADLVEVSPENIEDEAHEGELVDDQDEETPLVLAKSQVTSAGKASVATGQKMSQFAVRDVPMDTESARAPEDGITPITDERVQAEILTIPSILEAEKLDNKRKAKFQLDEAKINGRLAAGESKEDILSDVREQLVAEEEELEFASENNKASVEDLIDRYRHQIEYLENWREARSA